MKSFRFLLILVSVPMFFGCTSRKTTLETVNPSLSEDTLPSQCATAFLKALQGEKMDDACLADVAVSKLIAPGETEGKSDKKIQSEMLKPLYAKFDQNIERLKSNALAADVDLSKLSISDINMPEAEESASLIRAFVLHLTDGSKEYKIALTTVQNNGSWYLFEILNTSGVFNRP